MKLTEILLHDVMPSAPMEWLYVMARELPLNGIDTPNEVASFIAQIAHESMELTHLEENLSYSAERLMVVWPKRFPSYEIAQRYERVPERLANYVYASRMGNGDVDSGDGFRFHGRGPIQLTGRRNYTACGEHISENLIDFPERIKTPLVGIRSALWFWKTNKLDEVDDDLDVKVDTRRINGGEHGLVERQRYFNRCLRIIEAS